MTTCPRPVLTNLTALDLFQQSWTPSTPLLPCKPLPQRWGRGWGGTTLFCESSPKSFGDELWVQQDTLCCGDDKDQCLTNDYDDFDISCRQFNLFHFLVNCLGSVVLPWWAFLPVPISHSLARLLARSPARSPAPPPPSLFLN